MLNLFTPTHLEEVCPSCASPHGKKWRPHFIGEIHYKTLNCPTCDYKVFIRTEKLYSGHY